MTQTKITLSEDSIDDVLYFARAGETDDLVETLKELKAQHEGASEEDLLLAAVDEESGNTALHMSAANGHTETTKRILSLLPAPASPEAPPHALLSHKNKSGNTPLHWASLNGHLETVKVLVMNGNADPTLTNAAGHDAVYEAEINDKKDVVDWLLGQCEDFEQGVAGDQGEEPAEEKESEEKGKGKEVAPSEEMASLKVDE